MEWLDADAVRRCEPAFHREGILGGVFHFAEGALIRYPRLRSLSVIRAWAGLRPMSPDGKPIVELAAEPEGLCLAVGQSRRGICYAAGTGQLVTDLVMGRTPSRVLPAFRGTRFATAGSCAAPRETA